VIRDPSWLAAYMAAFETSVIEPPSDYTERQRIDFMSGFLVGARDARDREIKDELADCFQPIGEVVDKIVARIEVLE
jgi:hypothetical protein